MNITEVRVKLMRNRSDRLRAFCSITIDDDFVVHDLRVIEGRKGFFVAMPSRKLADNCPRCGSKNELRSKFCSDCGARLAEGRQKNVKRDKVHVDVAHPINTECREMLQERVLAAYEEEVASGGEGAGAGAEGDYYDEPEGEDEYYEEEAVAEAEAEQEAEIVMEVLTVVEEVEAELDEEQEVAFSLEPAHEDILEKEEEVGDLVESSLAEEKPFAEALDGDRGGGGGAGRRARSPVAEEEVIEPEPVARAGAGPRARARGAPRPMRRRRAARGARGRVRAGHPLRPIRPQAGLLRARLRSPQSACATQAKGTTGAPLCECAGFVGLSRRESLY